MSGAAKPSPGGHRCPADYPPAGVARRNRGGMSNRAHRPWSRGFSRVAAPALHSQTRLKPRPRAEFRIAEPDRSDSKGESTEKSRWPTLRRLALHQNGQKTTNSGLISTPSRLVGRFLEVFPTQFRGCRHRPPFFRGLKVGIPGFYQPALTLSGCNDRMPNTGSILWQRAP